MRRLTPLLALPLLLAAGASPGTATFPAAPFGESSREVAAGDTLPLQFEIPRDLAPYAGWTLRVHVEQSAPGDFEGVTGDGEPVGPVEVAVGWVDLPLPAPATFVELWPNTAGDIVVSLDGEFAPHLTASVVQQPDGCALR